MIKFINSFSGLTVDDITKAKDFYTKVLGLEILDENMGLRLSLPGGGSLFIYEKPNHAPAEYTVLNLIVDNINETIDELTKGGEVLFEKYDDLPAEQDDRGVLRGKAAGMGPDIAWFKDPAGNIISLINN